MESKFIKKTSIEGLVIIKPILYEQNGFAFLERYNYQEYKENNLDYKFVQENEVVSKKNVIRGMHININHPQGKLIYVLEGAILDVVIDLRKQSNTYLNYFSVVLSQENKDQLYIPEGLGHGYLALTDSKIVFKTTTHYIPNDEIGFAWNSKTLKDIWPIDNPILNKKDAENKDLNMVWRI